MYIIMLITLSWSIFVAAVTTKKYLPAIYVYYYQCNYFVMFIVFSDFSIFSRTSFCTVARSCALNVGKFITSQYIAYCVGC